MSIFEKVGLFLLTVCLLLEGGPAHAGAFKYRFVPLKANPTASETVVGCLQTHTVASQETLLDIARNYGLGFNEIQLLYPDLDPWIPEPGLHLSIPTLWILPSTKHEGVVINLPEMRLYRFFPRMKMVKTYPVGIGGLGSETPEGVYRVVEREVNPTWEVPPSLQEKHGVTIIPPGPDNPLGKYWIGLSLKSYGIHGTNFPWSVGRLISHGCIRLYPEHIAKLFKETSLGTFVEIIYEPVKIGFRLGEIFLEVHPDPYGKIADMETYTRAKFQKLGLWDDISKENLKKALIKCNGVPIRIGTKKKGGDRFSLQGGAGSSRPETHSFIQTNKEVK